MRSRSFKMGILAVLLALNMIAAAGCSSETKDPIQEAIANGKPVVTLDANGGLMGSSEKIQYILSEKGSYMPKPGEKYGTHSIPNAGRTDYTLVGWFRGTKNGQEITWGKEFDFDTEKVNESELTLYAKWARKAAFKIVYGENNQESKVVSNLRDDGSFKRPTMPNGYTIIGYYKDEQLTQEITFDEKGYSENFKHDFSEENLEITVYTKWLEGSYTLVSKPSDMASIKTNTNLYLMNDIDLTGVKTDAIEEYSGKIEGNGFKISNWTSERKRPGSETSFGLFTKLSGAKISNVTFENCTVTSDIFVSSQTESKIHYLAFLAGSADDKTEFTDVKLVNCKATYTQIRKPGLENLIVKGEVVADAKCNMSGLTVEGITVTVIEK